MKPILSLFVRFVKFFQRPTPPEPFYTIVPVMKNHGGHTQPVSKGDRVLLLEPMKISDVYGDVQTPGPFVITKVWATENESYFMLSAFPIKVFLMKELRDVVNINFCPQHRFLKTEVLDLNAEPRCIHCGYFVDKILQNELPPAGKRWIFRHRNDANYSVLEPTSK